MIKNFSKSIVLSSKCKESVIVFKYDGTPGYIIPSYNVSDVSVGALFVNGAELSLITPEKAAVYMDSDITAVFHVFSSSNNDFDLNMKFELYADANMSGSALERIDASVLNRPFMIDDSLLNMYNVKNPIVDNVSSYMLMRTNPKLSGNVKLMIDSSDNMYIDTFKVSDTLSSKRYRHQLVSANGIFANDIRKTFQDIPVGELFKVDRGDQLNIAIPKTELYDQYSTTYSYGARLLEDDLYPEDYSILAPIWINSSLPDFFVIFRLDGTYNTETYPTSNNQSGESYDDLVIKYMGKSDIVKSWGMGSSNNLGKYLRAHIDEMKDAQSPVYLPLSEYDRNVWSGISVKKGIVSKSQETSYFFEKSMSNFTDMNAFISLGFERNNVLCPNIINTEFAFNDNDADMYSMHRYFGLYMTENVLSRFIFYKESKNSPVFRAITISGVDVSTLITKDDTTLLYAGTPQDNIFDINGHIHPKYENRVLVINNSGKLTRLRDVQQITKLDMVSDMCNISGENIISERANELKIGSLASIKLMRPLDQGEHIRIIDYDENRIWEVYGIQRTIDVGKSYEYCSVSINDGYPTVYRNAFNAGGDVSTQLVAIKTAFDEFEKFETRPNVNVLISNDGTISFTTDSSLRNLAIQRITSQIQISDTEFSSNYKLSSVRFNGVSNIDYEVTPYDSLYGPIDFEHHGDRLSATMDFIVNDGVIYSIPISAAKSLKSLMYFTAEDGWKMLVDTIYVHANGTTFTVMSLPDPSDPYNRVLIKLPARAMLTGDHINLYDVAPINVSLMGINSVKDFDFNVYDASLSGIRSEYSYGRDNDRYAYYLTVEKGSTNTISDRGSYTIKSGNGKVTINGITRDYNISNSSEFNFNTFNGAATVFALSDSTVYPGYLDGSTSFVSYKDGFSEETVASYYVDDSRLKYGLVSPYVSKWVMQGMDCRNNDMRLMLSTDSSSMFDTSKKVISNFIPMIDSSIFSDEISFPIFKYMSTTSDSWKDYVYHDVNDVVNDPSYGNITLHDAMILKPHTDIFSKILFVSKGTSEIKNRISILKFNKYKNSVDTVYSGLKLSITSSTATIDIPRVETYDGYRFGFVSSPSRNYYSNKPLEVFINENSKSVLFIWYQGSDVLNFYHRNASYTSSKSILGDISSRDFSSLMDGMDASISSFSRAPFYMHTISTNVSVDPIFSHKQDFGYNESSPLVQLSHDTLSKIGNVLTVYGYDSSVDYINGYQPLVSSYNNFKGYFESGYTPSKKTAGSYVINHTNIYESNDNIFVGETCNISVLSRILNDNDIFYYIIRGDSVYTTRAFGENAFSVNINQPKSIGGSIYTHNGGFFPKFVDILNFTSNEDSTFISKSKTDFTASNTNVVSHNFIKQMWYHKVVNSISDTDVSTMRAIDYVKDYDVFKSLWDSAYYNVTTDAREVVSKNGFESTMELPSFFGSKLIRLPYSITFNMWDQINSYISKSSNEVTIGLNISLSLKRMFKGQSVFLSNWANLSGYENYVDGYIADTVLSYYNVALQNISVSVYSSTSSTTVLSSGALDEMTEISSKNFQTQLISSNGDYFYVINIKNVYGEATYHVALTLIQK